MSICEIYNGCIYPSDLMKLGLLDKQYKWTCY